MQKHPLLTLSSLNEQDSQMSGSGSGTQELIRTVRTPRCLAYQKEQHLQNYHQTQKLGLAQKTNYHRQKLPALKPLPGHPKENLFDLDLCYKVDTIPICQITPDKQTFVIRRIRAPSATSKNSEGKATTTGSHDSSLETGKDSPKNNATPSVERKDGSIRGRSEGKPMKTCRIVNSKKLPFQVQPQRTQRRRYQGLQEMTLDVSVILKKESEETLLGKESYEELCRYL